MHAAELSLLDPRNDVVFKLLLASESGRPVLRFLLEGPLRRYGPIETFTVFDPEIRPEQVKNKLIRFEVRVRFSNGIEVVVEMQCHREPYFTNRLTKSPRNVTVEKGRDLEPYRRWARAGTASGNHFWLQVNHTGRQTRKVVQPRPIAPSEGAAVKLMRAYGEPRALDAHEIPKLVARYADAENESIEVAAMLEREGCDLLEISGGNYETPMMFDLAEGSKIREAYFLEFARRLRRATRVPLMVTGGFRSLRAMEDALAEGALDVIGMARPIALEPDLPRRLLEGRSSGSVSVPRRFGFGNPNLEYFAEGGYYLAQMGRVANGRAPDPEFGAWRAMGVFVGQQIRDAIRYRMMRRHADHA